MAIAGVISVVNTRLVVGDLKTGFKVLLNLEWVSGVRVDGGEVELAGNQEQYGAHGGKASVAAGFAFGCLEETIEGLDEAVGLTGLGPGDDAVEVSADHAGDLLHRRHFGAQDIGASLLEHSGDDVDLLAVENGAQSFAVEPGAGGAFGGGLADQGVEVGASGGGQPLAVLEQRPAQSFEAGIAALFKAPGVVEGGRVLKSNVLRRG